MSAARAASLGAPLLAGKCGIPVFPPNHKHFTRESTLPGKGLALQFLSFARLLSANC
jgi:hypothetical protein